MKIVVKKRKYPILPISAMSDIAFLLLIFIMLVSLINYHKTIKIDYAVGESLVKTDQNKNIEIWVDKNGSIFYEGKIITLDDVKGIIIDAYFNSKTKTRFHIVADRDVEYRHINKVIEIFQELQIDTVSFVAKEIR